MKTIIAALAAFALLPAMAQSVAYTPTAREAQQARDNAKRDAKLADAMEKARLKEEAKPANVLILPVKAEPAQQVAMDSRKSKKPQHFTAVSPAPKKAEKPAKKKEA